MAQAASIAKMMISSDSAQQAAKSDTNSKKPSKKVSQSNEESAQTAETFSNNTVDRSQNSDKPSKQPFASVLNEKLEKRDTKANEEKKKINPDALTQALSMSEVSVRQKTNLLDRIQARKESLKTLRQKELTKVNISTNPQKTKLSPSVRIPLQKTAIKTSDQADKSGKIQMLQQNRVMPRQIQASSFSNVSTPKSDSVKEKKTAAQVDNHTQLGLIQKPGEKREQLNSQAPVPTNKPRTAQLHGKVSSDVDRSSTTETLQTATKKHLKFAPTEGRITKTNFAEMKQQLKHVKENSKNNTFQERKYSSTSNNYLGSSEAKSPVHENVLAHSHTPHQVVSAERESSVSQVLMQNKNATYQVLSSSQSAFGSSESLSPAQQILRSIQTDYNNDIRMINLTLSPAGLGMVRIHFQRVGEEISGLLEIQKPETRREIEKSMPQIISVLDGQGIQIRKIEITSTPNSHHKQSGFEGADERALNHQMNEQEQKRNRSLDLAENQQTGNSKHEIINHDNNVGYDLNTGLENLNMFA